MSGGIIRNKKMNSLELFNSITTFILDVDGVLTDGTVLVLDNGLQARTMNIKDGFALQLAVKKGFRVKIISGGNSPQVMERLNKLGVADISMGVLDKRQLVENFMHSLGLKKEEVLYMGDDIPDVPALKMVGLAACPSDAATEVKEIAHYISPFKGGKACVRDVIEKVMKLKGKWVYETEVTSS
jgi:3-deoxy-D-manno-octulosonate 8-phosphate phosphatase (KDO 8-P phosphatase)